MTASMEKTTAPRTWNPWRIARWTAAAVLLLAPLLMMQISEEWHWNIGSFLFAGALLGGTGLLYELAERASGSRAYRVGVAVALAASFLTVWTTLVRDDGTGIGFFLIILAAGVGAFAVLFEAAGMARTMLGVALMQSLFGLAIATAPVAALQPGGPLKALLFNGFFAALWLVAATLFRSAAKGAPTAATAR